MMREVLLRGIFGVVVIPSIALGLAGCDRVPEGTIVLCPGYPGEKKPPEVTCTPYVPVCFLDEKPPVTFQSCAEKAAYQDKMPYELACFTGNMTVSCEFALPLSYPEDVLTFKFPPKTKTFSYEGGTKKVTVTY
jgi:hypothetical protein